MNGAVVWYESRAVLGAVAVIIIAALKAFHLLPAGLTQDQVVSFLLIAIPAAITLEGRISAKRVIASTPAKAAAITAAAQAGPAVPTVVLNPGEIAVAAPLPNQGE